MGKKLYVKNLSYSVTENELKECFSSAGTVLFTKVLRDRETNLSRGSGFVEMATDEQAKTAIGSLSGTSLLGRTIFIEEAREKSPTERQGGRHEYKSDRSNYRPNVEYQSRRERVPEQPQMTMHSLPDDGFKKHDRYQEKRRFSRRDQ